jgi:hypothetical protein
MGLFEILVLVFLFVGVCYLYFIMGYLSKIHYEIRGVQVNTSMSQENTSNINSKIDFLERRLDEIVSELYKLK